MPITSSDLLLALGVTSLSFPRVTELPTSPDIGEVCFLQSANKAYIYTGVGWEILGNPPNSGSSSGGTTTVINNTIDLPNQSGMSGKYLATNGTVAAWADAPTELPAQTGNSGKMLVTDGSVPSWADAPTEIPTQTGNSGKVLSTNGIAASWVTPAPQASIYDIAYSNPEQVPTASTLLYFAFPRQVTIPMTFAGSYASAIGVFTGGDISIRRNGVEIGVVSFSSETGDATFSGSAPTDIVFGVGDIISLESPAETNILGVSIAVSGTTT